MTMQITANMLRTLTVVVLALLLANCRKSNNFSYRDGTPDDGAEVPNISIDTNVKNVDASKYAQARVFPGLVCNTEPRLNNVQVSLNLNYNYVGEDLRINVPPQPQFSTGLYVAPGELLIIDVPQTSYSLSVQVGAWTDNLSNVQNAPRDPIIYSKTQLAPGRNYVRNLYGGHVYIYSGKPVPTPITLTFSNVVKSPDFILGQTTNADWKDAITKSCVPYLELRSKNIIFVVPREYCITRPITDPTAAMQEWDRIVEKDFYEWEGLTENPADPIDRAPLLPWRIVLDIKPVVGYGHSGFPIVVQNDYSWFGGIGNVTHIDGGGNWGYFHEIGHNNQQPRYWSWSTLGETTCNLFAFKVANRLQAQTPTAWPPKHPSLATAIPAALSFAQDASTTKNFDGTDARINDPFARLTPFVQIFDKVPAGSTYNGWDVMGELYKKARRANRISLNDQDKRDFFYETVCDFTQKDWILFFERWGIIVSNISSNKMSKYPLMNQRIWEYNPLTRTGGNATFSADPYDRSTWSVTASSSQAGEGSIAAMTDGNPATYWHSSYSPMANPPHSITVKTLRPIDIKGFSFVQRQGGSRNIRNLRVEISMDGTNWTTVSGSPLLLQRVNTQQNFNLPSPVKAKFFRFTVANLPADGWDGSLFACLAEFNVIQ
jgi:hypothetical protein